MENRRNTEEPRKRGYVLERMKQITSSSERAVKWLLYVWLAAIFITLLGVLWYLFQ
ncbi:MAG: hypothetical protein L6Q51_00675 [Cyclobacteriaceae bacterium]|nr:hypothetical protein [Cyclobacteriaceae bacterium]